MDEETPRKRPSPSHDALDILRRVEPALMRLALDVESLRQDTVAMAVVASVDGAGAESRLKDVSHVGGGGPVQRLDYDIDHLTEGMERLRHTLDLMRECDERFGDSLERLHSSQAVVLERLDRLRDDLNGHGMGFRAAREGLACDRERSHQLNKRLAEYEELLLDGQKMLGGAVAQLDERLRHQDRELQDIRRGLKFLPVLWILAALIFAAVGAMSVLMFGRLG